MDPSAGEQDKRSNENRLLELSVDNELLIGKLVETQKRTLTIHAEGRIAKCILLQYENKVKTE